MRLKRLELENITSLKGKHTIDFDAISEYSELFAITGPTGSGKSSILTAVSMAIFGDHPKGLTSSDIITTGAPKGEIYLTFSKGRDEYEVHWTCQVLKKNGEPRKTPLTTRVITKNNQTIEESAQDILGLTYDQFSKVVILNQGQFSEFLNSTFTQRKDLLENLLGQHRFKSISPFLKRKIKDLDDQIEQKEKQGEFTLLLSQEDLEKAQDELESLNKERTLFDDCTPIVEKTMRTLKEIYELTGNTQKATENLQKDELAIEALHKDLNSIKKDQKSIKNQVIEFDLLLKKERPKISKAKALSEKRESLKKQFKKLDESIEADKEKKTDLTYRLQQNGAEFQALQKNIDDLSQQINIPHDQKQIKTIKANFQDAQALMAGHKLKLENLKNLEKHKSQLEKEGTDLKNKIEEAKNSFLKVIRGFNALEVIVGQINNTDNQGNSERLRQLHSLSKEFEIKNRTLRQKNIELSSIKEQITTLIKEIEGYDLKDIEEKIKAKQTEFKESQARLKKKEEEKTDLKGISYLSIAYDLIKKQKGEQHHCPVCDSEIREGKIREISDYLQASDKERLETVLTGVERLILDLQKSIAGIEKDIHHLETGLQNEIQKKENCRKKKEELENKIKALEHEILSIETLPEENIPQLLKFIHTMENYQELLRKLRGQWSDVSSQLGQIKGQIDQEKVQISQIEEKLFVYLPKDKEFNLEEALSYFENQVYLISKIEMDKTKARGLQDLTDNLKQQEKELIDVISQKMKESDEYAKEMVAIENEFQIEELPHNPEEIELELEAKEKELASNLERANSLILEKEVSYEKKRAQINMVKEQIEKSKELSSHYLANLKELLEKLIEGEVRALYHGQNYKTHENDESEEINKEEIKGDGSVIDFDDFLKGLEKTLNSNLSDSENLTPMKSFIEDIVTPFNESFTNAQKFNSERIIVLKTQIEENSKQQEKLLKIQEEIQELKKKRTTYEKLSPYLLKDAFRDFALEVLEESLLQMANREISSLAEGRYELIHGKAGKRRELLVKDKWQGHTLRKVSTLSGGETFLLSLGLALGLSEMTRGQTEVESFFIDEGFGTLDQESISQVLDCLMKMQSRGKQIGLISHVRSLTDQIPVRLELEKNNFGESQIQLI